uniref:Reverse transcriptase domain-containing protein n=1 Tax=Lactuca sativa TaxID=4236 RepID=A0A9R1UHU2_LACSA|nr:hypothetical protein LSAT_V11C900486330 [Lactuca sativa]
MPLALFMRLMNEVLKYFLGRFVVVYLDDILVFETLRAQKHYRKQEKCLFLVEKVAFLGFVVSRDGMSLDPSKTEAINNISEVGSFHGLASFYRRFVRDFSTIASPITCCLKKGVFAWGEESQKAFEKLKTLLCDAPILCLPDFVQPFEVECNVSGVGIRAVLIQSKRPILIFFLKSWVVLIIRVIICVQIIFFCIMIMNP